VSAPGFKKFLESNAQVIVATNTRKMVTLEIGAATEVVSVADTAPLLQDRKRGDEPYRRH
jgi:hypothetical protein